MHSPIETQGIKNPLDTILSLLSIFKRKNASKAALSKAFHNRRQKKGKLLSKDVSVKIKKFSYHKKIERLRNFNKSYKKLKLVSKNNYCS